MSAIGSKKDSTSGERSTPVEQVEQPSTPLEESSGVSTELVQEEVRHHRDITTKTVGGRLWYMYEYGHFYDVKLRLFDGEKDLELDAHRVVIMAASTFFLRFFKKFQNTDHRYVNMPAGMDESSLRKFLRYAYKDKVLFEGLDDLVKVFETAETLEAAGLMNCCKKYLCDIPLTKEIVFETLKIAEKMKCEQQYERCGNFVGSTPDMVNSPAFLDLPGPLFYQLFSAHDFNGMTEAEILEAGILWSKHFLVKQAEKGGSSGSPTTLAGVVKNLLCCIHFPSMLVDRFVNLLDKYPHSFFLEDLIVIFSVMADPRKAANKNYIGRIMPRQANPPTRMNDGPVFTFPTLVFKIPLDPSKRVMEAEMLHCKLTACPTRTVTFWGATISCRVDPALKVDMHYDAEVTGKFDGTCKMLTGRGLITFDKFKFSIMLNEPIRLASSNKLDFTVKLKFKNCLAFQEMPKISLAIPHSSVFVPYGRKPFFEGAPIITELYYDTKLIKIENKLPTKKLL